MADELPSLKVGTGWVGVTVVGPVDVKPTMRGYAPVIPVKVDKTGLKYILYINARSLLPLEELRVSNSGRFEGLRFELRKQSADPTARYEIRSDDGKAVS